MTILASFPAKRNVKVQVVDVEDDFAEFRFAAESLYPADEKSTKWNRRGLFQLFDDAVSFAQSILPD